MPSPMPSKNTPKKLNPNRNSNRGNFRISSTRNPQHGQEILCMLLTLTSNPAELHLPDDNFPVTAKGFLAMRFPPALLSLVCSVFLLATTAISADPVPPKSDAKAPLLVGIAEQDITPPTGFPMAGYYHERLAEGTINPLKAKAIVFREGNTAAALVVCDLIGVATDLSREVRKLASEKTGIPASNIVVSATHSHTAPDYMRELYLYLTQNEDQNPQRAKYIEKLIDGPVNAIVQAHTNAKPSSLASGSATQTTPVAFNRRSVMRDGSVLTWQAESNPKRIRAAGPIDPQIGVLAIQDTEDGTTRGILSNFALHLDTVGGMKWSADYPFFIERTLREAFGPELISIFGAGCCGDINHVNPASSVRNKSDFIGNSLGDSIRDEVAQLTPLEHTHLAVKSEVVQLPLEEATAEQVERSAQTIELIKNGGKADFFDHVIAYKKLVLDQIRHSQPHEKTAEYLTWGRSRSLAGIGETLPVDVTVITLGNDVAIVTLPGEVFVELGLAIKQASPFRTTIVVELSNVVETIYVPHRAAYASGSYEVTNSTVMPGSGEMLVETAVRLLRQAATENEQAKSQQTASTSKPQDSASHSRSTATTLVVTTPEPPTATSSTQVHSDATPKAEEETPFPKRGSSMIEHTVTFRLKHASGSEEETGFLNAAAELATIPDVRDFQIRRQTSVKNSHTFGISMRFDTPAQYKAYNEHPLHVRFVQQRWLNEVVEFQEADFEPLD